MKNPRRSEVAKDITDAILKSKADGTVSAKYWDKGEQERRMQECFEKWMKVGTVWSAAASKVRVSHLVQRDTDRNVLLTRSMMRG
jgi:hypothetical protein